VQFMGTYPIKIDIKGRASVPKPYREILEKQAIDQLVVTNYQDQGFSCLEVVPLPVWDKFLRKFQERPQMDPRVEVFRNFYVTPAHAVALDTAGRLLIPQHLRDQARLEHEIIVVGATDRFRIWDAESWAKVFAESARQFAEAKAALAADLS
jgi:MraZ protein